MLSHYILQQMRKARFKRLSDGTYFGDILGIRGVWANARTLSGCKKELQEVLEDWMVLSLKMDKKIPGFSVSIDQRHTLKNA
ncbi:MAG: type II toxin-antitoxin system HicB family antitoxin [bacterium]|nr:type II toxin-antitoxin system HicB family antitoxin [bacterium]